MSNKQEYLVVKFNKEGCLYDRRYYSTYARAWANTGVRDIMYVCKKGSIYYNNNIFGFTVTACDVIRTVRRDSSTF